MASKKKQTELAKKRAALFADYKRTFQEGPGRNVLLDLIKEHHVMGSTFVENDLYGREAAMREGERNVVLRILHNMNVDAEGLLRYLREVQEQQQNQFGGDDE
jgi:hypothetical protein